MGEISLVRGASRKKKKLCICRECGREFRATQSQYRCPPCKKGNAQIVKDRARLKRSLPFYLKTDV